MPSALLRPLRATAHHDPPGLTAHHRACGPACTHATALACMSRHASRVSSRHIRCPPCHPQGGPHNHTISGLACALKQAATPDFKAYQQQVPRPAAQSTSSVACCAACSCFCVCVVACAAARQPQRLLNSRFSAAALLLLLCCCRRRDPCCDAPRQVLKNSAALASAMAKRDYSLVSGAGPRGVRLPPRTHACWLAAGSPHACLLRSLEQLIVHAHMCHAHQDSHQRGPHRTNCAPAILLTACPMRAALHSLTLRTTERPAPARPPRPLNPPTPPPPPPPPQAAPTTTSSSLTCGPRASTARASSACWSSRTSRPTKTRCPATCRRWCRAACAWAAPRSPAAASQRPTLRRWQTLWTARCRSQVRRGRA